MRYIQHGLALLALAVLAIVLCGTSGPANTEHAAGPTETVKAYLLALKNKEACRGFDEYWNIEQTASTAFGPDYLSLDASRRRYVRELIATGFKASVVCRPIENLMSGLIVPDLTIRESDQSHATVGCTLTFQNEAAEHAGGPTTFKLALTDGTWSIVDLIRAEKPTLGRLKGLYQKAKSDGASVEAVAAAFSMGMLKQSVEIEQSWMNQLKNERSNAPSSPTGK